MTRSKITAPASLRCLTCLPGRRRALQPNLLTANRTVTVPDANGTLTVTIATGTAALPTSSIASGACSSAVAVTAKGVVTTDVITTSFNADPTSIAGYVPSPGGSLYIVSYPTAGNVNFKVCNNTATKLPPGLRR